MKGGAHVVREGIRGYIRMNKMMWKVMFMMFYDLSTVLYQCIERMRYDNTRSP